MGERPCWACCCSRHCVRNYCATCRVPNCDFRGICKYPHGICYSIMGIFSAIGGLMMNGYVLGSCFFQRIQVINPVTGDPIPGSERGYGFFARETDYGAESDYKQCTYYPTEEYDVIYDGWMKSGRFFAFVSIILAAVCFAVLFLTCCVAFSPSMFERWLMWMYIGAACTIALSFLMFGSEFCGENECKVADGSGYAISCFMFHLVNANTVKSMAHARTPTPRRRDDEPDEDEEALDDLYYEDETDKYPPPLPDGQRRGVRRKANGETEYDDGEDYYDELGRMKGVDYNGSNYKDNPEEQYDNEGEYGNGEDEEEAYEDGEYGDGEYDDDDYDNEGNPRYVVDDDGNKYYGEGQPLNADLLDDPSYPAPSAPPQTFDEAPDGNLGVGYEPQADTPVQDAYGADRGVYYPQDPAYYGDIPESQPDDQNGPTIT